MVSLSFHNWTVYNTHIPANAITTVAIAALCLLAINFHKGRQGAPFMLAVTRIPFFSFRGTVVLCLALALAGTLGRQAWFRYQSLRLDERWTRERPFLIRGDLDDSKFALLSEALRWRPWNDRVHFLKATAYEEIAATKDFIQFLKKREMLRQAETALSQAIRLRPAHAVYWAALGRVEMGLQQLEISGRAFHEALKLARTNGYIRRDYGYKLLWDGDTRGAAARLIIACNYTPAMGFRQLLDSLASRTSDTRIWKSISKYQPDDLRVYSGFLRSQGYSSLAAQILEQADMLEKRGESPAEIDD